MKWIPLTRDQIAVVDDEDYEMLSQWKWCCYKGRSGFYAVRGANIGRGKTRLLQMHRVVMGAPKGMVVDHINRNTLDNRRSNLRVCTQGQNCMNRGPQKNNRSSPFKGVNIKTHSKNPKLAYWRATFRGDHIGNFETEELAAKAYDLAAKSYGGEFALLNFPEVQSCRT